MVRRGGVVLIMGYITYKTKQGTIIINLSRGYGKRRFIREVFGDVPEYVPDFERKELSELCDPHSTKNDPMRAVELVRSLVEKRRLKCKLERS